MQDEKKLMDCKEAITDGINNGYNNNTYSLSKDIAKNIVDEFGIDTTKIVIANSVQFKNHDGRISNDTKDWAKDIENPIPQDKQGYFVVDNNAGLLNIVANQFRKLEKEIEKPSVTKQLSSLKADITPKVKEKKHKEEVR